MNNKDKKIGIITYHRAYNYGSALQAFALNYFLRLKGYEVETIDYRTKRQQELYKLYEESKSLMSIIRNMYAGLNKSMMITRKIKFDDFLMENLPMSQHTYSNIDDLNNARLDYDYYICGSDQVWNPNTVDFDEAYLLSFVEDKSNCVSYAPSIATKEINSKFHELFESNLKKFRAISVREDEGAKLIEAIVNRDITTVPDPVFLLERQIWEGVSEQRLIKEPYIFCYFIGDVKGMRGFSKKMSKKLNLPLVVINSNLRDILYRNIKLYDAGPKEFISLIKNSEYICTNSFHAVAFSVIFEKNYWVFVDENNEISSKSRIYNISKKLNLEDRILTFNRSDVIFNEHINFSKSTKIISEERMLGMRYLMEALAK